MLKRPAAGWRRQSANQAAPALGCRCTGCSVCHTSCSLFVSTILRCAGGLCAEQTLEGDCTRWACCGGGTAGARYMAHHHSQPGQGAGRQVGLFTTHVHSPSHGALMYMPDISDDCASSRSSCATVCCWYPCTFTRLLPLSSFLLQGPRQAGAATHHRRWVGRAGCLGHYQPAGEAAAARAAVVGPPPLHRCASAVQLQLFWQRKAAHAAAPHSSSSSSRRSSSRHSRPASCAAFSHGRCWGRRRSLALEVRRECLLPLPHPIYPVQLWCIESSTSTCST